MALSYRIHESVNHSEGIAVIRFNEKVLSQSLEDGFRNILGILSLKKIRHIVLDLSNAESLDSFFIALLVQVFKDLQPSGGHLSLACVGKNLKSVLHTVRLDDVLPVYDSLVEAIEHVEECENSK